MIKSRTTLKVNNANSYYILTNELSKRAAKMHGNKLNIFNCCI